MNVILFIIIGSIIYFIGMYMAFVEYVKRIGIWFLCPIIFPIVIIVCMLSWISYIYMKLNKDEYFLWVLIIYIRKFG